VTGVQIAVAPFWGLGMVVLPNSQFLIQNSAKSDINSFSDNIIQSCGSIYLHHQLSIKNGKFFM
jgi:hypothetical protein